MKPIELHRIAKQFINASILLCAVLSPFAPNFVLAQSPIQAVLKGDFYERMNPDVDVSGSVLVGISTGDSFNGTDLKALAISATGSVDAVCLTVQSIDGVYASRNEYTISSLNDMTITVRLPYDQSAFLDELTRYRDGELALAVYEGGCNQGKTDLRAIPVARLDALTTKDLRIYVNSLGATDVFVGVDQVEGHCRLVTGRSTLFDHICDIDLALLKPSAEGHRVLIERERFGRVLPSTSVRISLQAHP